MLFQINIQLKLRGSGFKDINMIYIDVIVQLLSHCPAGWWVMGSHISACPSAEQGFNAH